VASRRRRNLRPPGSGRRRLDAAAVGSAPDVTCPIVRESLSARLDGEVAAVGTELVRLHLASCASCQEYDRLSAELKRSVSIGPTRAVPDLTDSIVAAIRAAPDYRPVRARAAARGAWTMTWSLRLRWAVPTLALAVLMPTVVVGAVGHVHVAPMSHPGPCLRNLDHVVGRQG
jgi:predicted anti-sigma-YlaC factor YlaD